MIGSQPLKFKPDIFVFSLAAIYCVFLFQKVEDLSGLSVPCPVPEETEKTEEVKETEKSEEVKETK